MLLLNLLAPGSCALLQPQLRRSTRAALVRAQPVRLAVEEGPRLQAPSDAAGLLELTFGLTKLEASPLHILAVTDTIDECAVADSPLASTALFLAKTRRSQLLVELLREDRPAYIETASFLNIPRLELPNLQDVPRRDAPAAAAVPDELDYRGEELVADCTLPDLAMGENLLEGALLRVTRDIYAEKTDGVVQRRTDTPGIPGLLDEMKQYMLSSEGRPAEKQQQAILETLLVLMTPVIPPIYRFFMGGIVPSREKGDPAWLVDGVQWVAEKLPFNAKERLLGKGLAPGTQLGPLFYAPFLTSVVAPFAFGFLVGPGVVNRRSDGALGGLVVEKCKFLQESNCKGMCLNSCKLPAQQLFDGLGLPLRVSPNFETQECQWNFGEVAPLPAEDPTWPKGCLVGCGSRELMKEPVTPPDGGEPRVMVPSCV
eukprot:Transcript_1161.p1 GENE.Transcript_1161~~Transcript_1161.p1  ORF type:complete len:428 (-),score=197.28 Transcript_1161:149-1432(-)